MEGQRRERKVVTVLFADLVGFTARAESLDPEDVEAILRPYHERLRSELERFGGTVEKFIGDAVMALFGAPVAHEDDPERAVRAALAIRDWARDEGGVEVRIAVNTGEALINLDARAEAGEGMAAGDVVNTTARLQSAAPVNGVLVGEATQRATGHAIDYRADEPVEAKGKTDPIPVWEAVNARSRLGVDLLRTVRSPLVGRERELNLLRDTLVRVREERSSQLVTLVGVPGIGKSRLVYELMQFVQQGGVLTYWRQGRSLPYGESVSYWALSEIVKAQAGVLESDTDEDVQRKLRTAVDELVGDGAEAERIGTHLRPLAGAGADAELSGDRRSEAFAAWRRFFEAMAERRPLVLVFDDVQWADDGLLDFVDHLVDWSTSVPVLVVCTARPELFERRPGWGGGKLNSTTLSLSPLSDEETAHLLGALLARPVLDASAQQRLLAHAGGNPLYAEQYADMHAERGETAQLPLPESVQGIIAARLDLLPVDEKALLQDASVLGKVFWLGGVVDGRSRAVAEEQLHVLERKGFVQRATRSSVGDEAEYSFRHLLVREVAYGQIPRAERVAKHQAAAEWIESLGRPADHAETLAHHYSTALELARASSSPTDHLAERGRLVLREAGDRAMSLNAFEAAASSYAAALALWALDDAERPLLLFSYGAALVIAQEAGGAELTEASEALVALGDHERAAEALALLADGRWRAGRRDEAYAYIERALGLLQDAPASPAKARVLSEISRYHMLADRREDSVRIGREAVEMASSLGLDEVRAHALNNIGTSLIGTGRREGLGSLEESVAIAERIGSIESLRAYNNLFAGFAMLGELDRAAAAIDAGLEAADRFGGLGANARWLRFERLPIAYWSGVWDEALDVIETMLAEVGDAHALSRWCLEYRGRIRLARGDVAGAVDDAEKSLALGREAKDPQTLLPALSFAAFAFLATGRHEEAAVVADELVDLEPLGGVTGNNVFADLPWILRALGRSEELLAALEGTTVRTPWIDAVAWIARADFVGAAEIYADMGTRPYEAFARLRAAERLVDEGHRAEADEQLHRALAFWRSVGATSYIRQGEALLAATA
jgi:class 3 adenylate cyclase/tetratricopeptide (TPR) repeat protein